MAVQRMISGCVAAAEGARLADVDVITSYPIRPYTGIMSELAQMVADGRLDAEFVHGEGEHGQLSVTYGASAAGARAFTGSSGVGVTYAMELYSPMSGERLPAQMSIADRTLDPPGDFGSEHTDALCCRDQGWIQGWASTPQEALDNTLMYYAIGEDQRVALPQYMCQDGYFVSHILGDCSIPDDDQAAEYLPPFAPIHVLDPAKPEILGPQFEPAMGPAAQYNRVQVTNYNLITYIPGWVAKYNEIVGREYDPFFERYLTDDAVAIVFMQGAHAETAKIVAKRLRNLGDKVGVVRLRLFRPFPTEAVREELQKYKAVAVCGNSLNLGIACSGDAVLAEVRCALYGHGNVLTMGFVGGLGGEVFTREEFYRVFKKILEVAETGVVDHDCYWMPFEL